VQYQDVGFAIYDIKTDCAHPKLLAALSIPGGYGHAGNFSEDGLTYYGAAFNGNVYAIDVADPKKPKLILNFPPPGGLHDLSTSPDGNRLYLADSGRTQGVRTAQNGLVILDVSQIQRRVPNPKVSVVSKTYWDDGAIMQTPLRVLIGGKPYIITQDENGSGGLQGWQQACALGLPPFGYGRIFDASDERAPKLVSNLMLQVQLPSNCPTTLPDTTGTFIFSYDSHYCSVDNPADARLLACAYWESGMRVFNIADPVHPKEIAYYNPPSQVGEQPTGSVYQGAGAVQWELSMPQVRLDRCEIWMTSTLTGFKVLKLTNGLWNCKP
jgi:hypothetical protein